jgi:hypothetical protein
MMYAILVAACAAILFPSDVAELIQWVLDWGAGRRHSALPTVRPKSFATQRAWGVVLVAHQQLQCVLAPPERNLGLGLPGAEMQMVEVVWDRPVERRQIGIYQQVMMAGILAIRAGGGDAHVPQTEIKLQLRRNENLVEHLAGAEDFQLALATYKAACGRWPRAAITLRQGARVIEDSRRMRVADKWPDAGRRGGR